MTDDPAGFAAFRWNEYTLAAFQYRAEQALADELLQKPDMTTREQSYFFRKAFVEVQLRRRTDELKAVLRVVERKDEEIKILNAKLEQQGDTTKQRGAFIWQELQTLERRYGAATLEQVDAMKLLMKKAPLEIRIKPSAKNPYKLTTDALAWTIRFAEEAGKKVERIQSTIKKLRCLRFFADVTIPKRTKKRRRLPGEPKQMEAWAVNYTPPFRELQKNSYDPGG